MPRTHPDIYSFLRSFSHWQQVSVRLCFCSTAPGGSRAIAVLPSYFFYYGSISSPQPSCTPINRPLTGLRVDFKISGRRLHPFQSGASYPIIACIGQIKMNFPTSAWHTHSLCTKLRYPRDFTQENCVPAAHLQIPSSRWHAIWHRICSQKPDQLNAKDPVFELLRSGFYLLNSRFLIVSSNNEARNLSLDHNSPIVVSSRLISYNPEAAYQVELTGANLDSLSARSISQVFWIIGRDGHPSP